MDTQEFKEKVGQIGAILEMSVEFPSDADMSWHRWAYLKNGDRSIRISNGSGVDENKFHISGDFPRTIKGEPGFYGNSQSSINVSVSKTPEQIAKDIERRLLPVYLPELGKAVNQVNQINIYHQKRKSNIQKLADYFQIKNSDDWKNNRESSIYVYGQIKGLGPRIETYGEDTVKFELEVTPEKAIEVFNFLKLDEEKGREK